MMKRNKKFTAIIAGLVLTAAILPLTGVLNVRANGKNENPLQVEENGVGWQYFAEVSSYREKENLAAPIPTDKNGDPVDGYVFSGWYSDVDNDENTVADRIPCEIGLDKGPAWAKFVPKEVLSVKAQISNDLYDEMKPEKGAIRFVTTVDSEQYLEVGFLFTYSEETAKTPVKRSNHIVYDKLYAVGANGTGEEDIEIKPTDFSPLSLHFKAWTWKNVSSSLYDLGFAVTPFWITMDGTKVTGVPVVKTINQGIESTPETSAELAAKVGYNYYTSLDAAIAVKADMIELLKDPTSDEKMLLAQNEYIEGYGYATKCWVRDTSGDLLDKGSYEWGDFKDGTPYVIDNRCTDTSSDDSLYSWKFSTDTAGGGWPQAQIKLDKSYDLSTVKLQFDVKFECEGAEPTKWIAAKLYNSDWAQITKEKGYDVTGDGWHTVTINASDWYKYIPDALNSEIPIEEEDLKDVYLITFVFNFDANTGRDQAVYIDNVRMVEKEELSPDEKEAASGDLLYGMEFVKWGPFYENPDVYVQDKKCTDVSSSESGYSWKFSTNASGNGWPRAQFQLGKSYDLSNKQLQFDVKFECDGADPCKWVSVWLFDKEWQQITEDKGIDVTGDGWQTITFDPSYWEMKEGKNLKDVSLIAFIFNFDKNMGHDQAVYIDNLKIITEE